VAREVGTEEASWEAAVEGGWTGDLTGKRQAMANPDCQVRNIAEVATAIAEASFLKSRSMLRAKFLL
jgi:hypothetical protein